MFRYCCVWVSWDDGLPQKKSRYNKTNWWECRRRQSCGGYLNDHILKIPQPTEILNIYASLCSCKENTERVERVQFSIECKLNIFIKCLFFQFLSLSIPPKLLSRFPSPVTDLSFREMKTFSTLLQFCQCWLRPLSRPRVTSFDAWTSVIRCRLSIEPLLSLNVFFWPLKVLAKVRAKDWVSMEKYS